MEKLTTFNIITTLGVSIVMDIMLYNIAISMASLIVGYLFGSIPFGIIIGKDLRYVDGRVITDRKMRAKTDATIKGLNGDEELGDKIIRNTYKTLLTRGQKGCFIYCEDKALSDYIKEKLSKKLN